MRELAEVWSMGAGGGPGGETPVGSQMAKGGDPQDGPQPAVVSSKSRWHWVTLAYFAGRVFFSLLSLCDYCSKEWLCGFPGHPQWIFSWPGAHALTLPSQGAGVRRSFSDVHSQPGV